MAKTNLTINYEDRTFSLDRAMIPGGNWRNFSGGPTKFDPRNTKMFFEIFLSDDEAEKIKALGYNVKWLEPRNDSEPKQAHLRIFVNYNVPARFQPKVWLVPDGERPELQKEDTIGLFDGADIKRAKIQVRPYDWELASGSKGTKAMLNQAYIVLEEDDFGAEFYEGTGEEEVPFE